MILIGHLFTTAAFMDIFQSIRREPLSRQSSFDGADGAMNKPIVVQCSNGSGRSGVFILSEILMFWLEHENASVDQVTEVVRVTAVVSLIKKMLISLSPFTYHLSSKTAQSIAVVTVLS